MEKSNPDFLVPLCLHGDGGRHYRRSEIMILQFQSCLGQGSRQSASCKQKRGDQDAEAQINLLVHSFGTRFLIATMLKQHYADDTTPLLNLLGHVSSFFARLYDEGMTFRGRTAKFALLAAKGDLPFISKITAMERNF